MHPVKFLSRGRGGGLWWPAGQLLSSGWGGGGQELWRLSGHPSVHIVVSRAMGTQGRFFSYAHPLGRVEVTFGGYGP